MEESVKLILGTMTFGEQVFGEEAAAMVDYFLAQGYDELDTAYVYNEGECERIIGETLSAPGRGGVKLATKVNPRVTGRLDPASVASQFTQSLQRLGIDRADILYLHFPDPLTPLEDTLGACARLQAEGRFSELGLSNFPAWLVAEAYHLCLARGWKPPTVYQGLYNPISRHAESELDRALDHYGLRFYAYNPLAGGLLTDKYREGPSRLKPGRFLNRPGYQARYWKASFFEAADRLRGLAASFGTGLAQASYRWLAFHSMLKGDRQDGIIVGASSLAQLKANRAALAEGPLPPDLVQAFQEAWEGCRADAPAYFRYLSLPEEA